MGHALSADSNIPLSGDTSVRELSVAVVSGAGSGIGRAIAIALSKRCAEVFLVGRTHATLTETRRLIAEEGDARAVAIVADLADGLAARRIVQTVLEQAKRLDIMVHAAATCSPASVLDLTDEQWDATLDVALRGTALCTIEAARQMRAQGRGRIVLITSIDAELVEPGLAHYCAAKAGLAAFGRCMAVELGPHGVAVNSVAPGWVRTDNAAARLDRATPDSLERLNAVRRAATPDEIANVVASVA